MDNDIPADYEPCGTCGYDHSYDFPVLPESDVREAQERHNDSGDAPAS